jgi:uncharacterized protein (TIRG00374 family)
LNPRFTFYKGRSSSASSPPGPGLPSWGGWAIALAGLLVIVILFRMRGASFDWGRFVRTLYQVDWVWLAASMLLMLLTYLLRALRWEVMLRPSGRSPGIRKLTYDTVIGFAAATVLGRVGEVVRPYLISISAGVSFSSQMAVWLLERILDLLSILLIFGFALLQASPRRLAVGPELGRALSAGGYLAALFGFVCLILLFVFRNFSGFANQRILGALKVLPEKHHDSGAKLLESLALGLESTRQPRLLLLLVWYTLLLWATIVVSYSCLFHSFRLLGHLSITDAIVILGFIGFGSILQLPGIGGGLQVICILCLTKMYGVPLEIASGIAIIIWLLTFAVAVPFGTLCAIHEGLNWRKIRQLTASKPEEAIPEEGAL